MFLKFDSVLIMLSLSAPAATRHEIELKIVIDIRSNSETALSEHIVCKVRCAHVHVHVAHALWWRAGVWE